MGHYQSTFGFIFFFVGLKFMVEPHFFDFPESQQKVGELSANIECSMTHLQQFETHKMGLKINGQFFHKSKMCLQALVFQVTSLELIN